MIERKDMKRGIYIVCILLLLLYVLMGGKEEASASLDETSIYFFHDTACGSCDGTEDFLAVVSEQISGYKEVFPYRLVMYNVFKSEERDSAQGILAEYGLSMEEASFPMLLIDGKVYEGVGEIEANLKREYLSSVGSGAVYFYREVPRMYCPQKLSGWHAQDSGGGRCGNAVSSDTPQLTRRG